MLWYHAALPREVIECSIDIILIEDWKDKSCWPEHPENEEI